MTRKQLRVGIAGAGWVAGDRHLPVLMARRDVDVVAIYDRNLARAQAMSAKVEGKTTHPVLATSDLDAFLGQDLDVVHVCTSPWSHHAIAMAALSAKAHVFTEKPMAMNSAEAQEMADKAAEVGRLLCVSHNFLHSRSMSSAKRLLAGSPVDYVLGLQLSAKSRRLPSWYKDLPGGLLFDEIPHMIYSLTDLLGGDLSLDHARATYDDDGQPRTVELLVRGRTGRGQVTMVFCAPVSEWHLMISSPARVIGLDLFRDIALTLAPDGAHGSLDIARSSLSAVSGHVGGFARAGVRWLMRRQYWGHDVLISAFLDAARNGAPSPVPTADALGVVRLVDDVLRELNLTGDAFRS